MPRSITTRLRLWRTLWLLLAAGVLQITAAPPAQAAASPPAAEARRPNVLIWLMDDVGYGQLGVFGGPVETPTLDRLAARGLRFNNFHATAICSSSRAALLTGRNHHAVSFGSHAGMGNDDPGYRAHIPPSAGSLAKILRSNGYATWAIGKWDQLPIAEITQAGPFTNWPSGQGFDRFYGFLYAETDHFAPLLWSDHTPIEPAKGRKDYHLTTDLADHAIDLIHELDAASPDQPFLLYWATGAGHAPHHAPREYREHYRGRFDEGWDRVRAETLARQKVLHLVPANVKLPPRPEHVEAWESLPADDRRIAARSMEAFAAQLTHADHEFGRILSELERVGKLENTIVLVTSDNGASAAGARHGTFNTWRFANGLQTETAQNLPHYEDWGGPSTYPEYPAGWAMAGNTPFKHYKTAVHFGGEREPMIVSWPGGIRARGEIRSQFHHINDVMPTILELTGITAPAQIDGVAQQRIDGVSMRYAFDAPNEPTRHGTQYFEMMGNRAMVADGWKAVVLHRKEPWKYAGTWPLEDDVWELYDLRKDFNELDDLAKRNPRKLAELQALFDTEAKRNNVYPLLPDFVRFQRERADALLEKRQSRFVYRYGDVGRIPSGVAPPTALLGSFDIEAGIVVPEGEGRGVIVAEGGSMGGYSLYLAAGRPVFCYNFLGTRSTHVRASEPLPAGAAEIRVKLRKTEGGGAAVALLVGGSQVAQGTVEQLVPRMFEGSDTFSVGRDQGSRVTGEYGEDNAFSGRIEQVVIDLAPQ